MLVKLDFNSLRVKKQKFGNLSNFRKSNIQYLIFIFFIFTIKYLTVKLINNFRKKLKRA